MWKIHRWAVASSVTLAVPTVTVYRGGGQPLANGDKMSRRPATRQRLMVRYITATALQPAHQTRPSRARDPPPFSLAPGRSIVRPC